VISDYWTGNRISRRGAVGCTSEGVAFIQGEAFVREETFSGGLFFPGVRVDFVRGLEFCSSDNFCWGWIFPGDCRCYLLFGMVFD
jgi:hypothetical protein